LFPDDISIAWKVDTPETNGIQQLMSKSEPTLAWYVKVGQCSIYFLFEFKAQSLDEVNGKLLEIFMHCLADTLAQQEGFIENEHCFNYQRIVIHCRAALDCLVDSKESLEGKESALPIIKDIDTQAESSLNEVTGRLYVNLSYVQKRLINQPDASFEEECLKEWLNRFSSSLGLSFDKSIIKELS